MKNIVIIIPAYNEHENIIILIKKIKKLSFVKEIVVVDDSENDLTKKAILKSKLKISYFKRKQKLGRGSAVLFGIKKIINKISHETIIVEMDADLSHNPNELKRNIYYFESKKLDLLICSRYLKKSKILNWGISRRILSKLSNLLARFFLRVPVSDYTNGYRLYTKRASKLIISKCGRIGDGFIILSEILLCVYRSNLKIDELPTTFVNRVRGASSVNILLILQSLFGLIKLAINKKKYN